MEEVSTTFGLTHLSSFDSCRMVMLVVLLFFVIYSLISTVNNVCSEYLKPKTTPAPSAVTDKCGASTPKVSNPKSVERKITHPGKRSSTASGTCSHQTSPLSYSAQGYSQPYAYSPVVSNCSQGLHGKVYMLAVFVSTTMTRWDRESVSNVEHQILESQDWIKKQASLYGCHDISFVNGTVGGCYDGFTTWLYYHPQRGDTLEKKIRFIDEALSVEHFASLYQLAESECRRTNCMQFHVLLFSKSAGHSHAYSPWRVNNRPFGLAILYDRFQGEYLKLGTICHEMLHCFGAADLYRRKGFSGEKEDYVRSYYPNSIMQEDMVDSLCSKRIDPFNAWLMGIGPKRNDFDWLINRFER